MRSAVMRPPLPWPSRMRSLSPKGTGHASDTGAGASEDIVGPERDVHQIPHDVIERHVGLLDTVDAERRHHERVVCEVVEAPAVLAGERDRHEAEGLGDLERV